MFFAQENYGKPSEKTSHHPFSRIISQDVSPHVRRRIFFINQIASERVGIMPSVPMDFVIPVGPLLVNICLSCIASFVLFSIIPKFREMFISAGLYGIDMNKLPQQRCSSVTTNAQQLHENVQEKPKM